MEDEDEIDVLGEFNLENLLSKNEEQMSPCYDREHQMGLHCESSWMLDSSTQPCWSDPQTSFTEGLSYDSCLETADGNTWSDKERYLLEKGLELFGRSWSRLAQYIGTKSSSQVKLYVKSMGYGWSSKSSVSTSCFGVDGMDFNFTEIIDDMEIPASMEEVIAVVSTAQPTVVLPSSQREAHTDPYNCTKRKIKCRRKKHASTCSKRNHVSNLKPKEVSQIYNAEEIKDVLTSNKEQDSIVLPNGEEVIRIRHGSSLSEESDVDIDVNSESENKEYKEDKQHLEETEESQVLEEEIFFAPNEISEEVQEELFEFNEDSIIEIPEVKIADELELNVNDVEKEVSVFTDGYIGEEHQVDDVVEKETQVFKGNLVTPSGKVMTVIVDDPSNSKSLVVDDPVPSQPVSQHNCLHERLDAVYQLPPPTQEIAIQPHLVTREEQMLHPEFFHNTYHGLNRYLKIRNHIVDCWKNSKPNYVSKTLVQTGLRGCGDVHLISRIHAYLEQKGFINFGCEQCHYKKSSHTSDVFQRDFSDQVSIIVEVDSCHSPTPKGLVEEITHEEAREETVEMEKKETARPRKKKVSLEEICEKPTNVFTARAKKPSSKYTKSYKHQNIRPTLRKPNKNINNNNCDGGYTMMHMETGEVIVQHNQVQQLKKMHTRGVRPVRLIHCKNYSVTKKAPYKVELEVGVLLLVDVHSHLSPRCEVIGLLGGRHRASDNVLTITMAVPCKTVLSSNIHCDMCPVSQCESSEMITSRGLSVVGWYHSHPNFDPSPSDTDVDTQNTLQSWFNDTGKPFVGLIISPYFSTHNVSTYRCCQVETETKGPVPYQLEVKLVNLCGNNLVSLKQSIESAFKTLQTYEPIRQLNVYKCLESVKHHLRKASPKMEEEKVSLMVKEIRESIRDGFPSLARKK